MNLSGNQLSGAIPSELRGLSSLSTLNLSGNQLSGSIPSALGGLSSLGTLNLSNNSLSGPIPSTLSYLSNLTSLNLYDNELDWEIPEELNQLDKLEQVGLYNNFGLISPVHLNFTDLSKAHLGYMETETWAVADFSSATGWSLSDDDDSSKFSITTDGVLTFSSPPDYESPSDADGNNDYYVDVTASVGGTEKTAQIRVTVMDRDIALSVNPIDVDEGDESATSIEVTATREGDTTQATTITLSLAGSAGADDYATTTLNSIEIPANSASATNTLSLDPTNDAIVEGDEVVKVVGASGDKDVSPAWITINDNDSGKLSLSGSGTAVSEGNDASLTVTLSDAIGPEVTVGWSVTPDSGDFISPSGSVTFAAGSAANATQSFIIAVLDDDLSEGEEPFTVSLGAVTGEISDRISVKADAGSAEVKIEESDPITVTLSGDSSVDEGESATYTVRLSPEGVKPTDDLTVDYATGALTDTAGSADYQERSGTLRFTASDAADKTVTVQTTDDSIAERDETFSFGLSNVTGGGGPDPSLGDPPSITTTIIEPTNITLSVSPTEVSEGVGSVTTVTVTAMLEENSTLLTSTTVSLGLSGTATGLGVDYTSEVLPAVTIESEETSGTGFIYITLTDDAIFEGYETIVVGGSGDGLKVSSATVRIADNDEEPTGIGLSVSPTEVSEGDLMATTVTLTATLEGGTTRNAATTVALSLSGTATGSDTDYTAVVPSEMTIPAEAATGTATLSITPTDDEIVEGEETIRVEGTVSGFTVSPTEITINDGDRGTLSLSGPDTAVAEGSDASFTVRPSHVIGQEVTVGWSVMAGSATSDDYCKSSGTLNDDCTSSGTLTLAVGPADDSEESFTIVVEDDDLSEGEESFTVSLGAVTGEISDRISVNADAGSAEVKIEESDKITVTLSGDSSVDEGGMASYTVSLSPEGVTPTDDLTVDYATAEDTAGSADYEGKSGTLTFTSSDAAAKTVAVQTTEDSVVEGDETFSFGLSLSDDPGGGGPTPSLSDPSSITTTIDDDDAAALSLSGPDTAVSEGSDASFTVTLSDAYSDAIGQEVTVGWSVMAGSATSDDYCISSDTLNDDCTSSGTLTFPAGSAVDSEKFFTIVVEDDDLSEDQESFTVSLGAITGDISDSISLDPQADSAVVLIGPSDPISVTLSGDSSVDEGESATYTVSLSPDGVTPTADLTVHYDTADDTAGSDDYEGVSGTLTFASSDTEDKTVTVQTTEDSSVEGDETFFFTLRAVSGGGGPTRIPGSASYITTTIIDDDRRRTRRPQVNNAPTFNEGATTTRAVLENSEVGTEVGEPVLATDPDGDQLEYWLWGTDWASFDVNPRTGQLSGNTALDREMRNEYSVRMSVQDGLGGSDSIGVTIIVENVDEPPERPAVPDIKVCSHSTLVLNWSAPGNQGPEITNYDVRYREKGQAFQDAGYQGPGTSLILENLQSETSYEIQVRAANAEGTSPWSESVQCETVALPSTLAPSPPTEPTNTPSSALEPTATAADTDVPNATSTPVPTPVLKATPTSAPTPPPSPVPTPTAEPIPLPIGNPVPTRQDTPPPTSSTDEGDDLFPWWAVLGVVLGAILGALALVRIRRKSRWIRFLWRADSPPATVFSKVGMAVRAVMRWGSVVIRMIKRDS